MQNLKFLFEGPWRFAGGDLTENEFQVFAFFKYRIFAFGYDKGSFSLWLLTLLLMNCNCLVRC